MPITFQQIPPNVLSHGQGAGVHSVFRIAIVGGGPKGTYGFERLAACLSAHPVTGDVEIHVFNRSAHFGAGDVYRTDQPDYLLINFSIGNITMWIDEEPAPVVPHPLPLTQWLREQHDPPLPVDEYDYAPRAVVGRYLEAGFQAIAAHLPPGVQGRYLVGEVRDIRREAEGYYLTLKSEGKSLTHLPGAYQCVLLATGHPQPVASAEAQRHQRFAQHHPGTGFVPFIYPVSDRLSSIPAGSRVAIKGMGLTFVDAVLALTEGRGGRFGRDQATGILQYHASGAEPACLYPFSRSGMPMLPRGPACGPSKTPLRIFTREALRALQEAAPAGQLDFEADLWPLLRLEMIVAYYRVLFGQQGERLIVDAQNTLSRDVLDQIDAFHERHLGLGRFEPEVFLDPLGHAFEADPAVDVHRFLVRYLEDALAHARRGEARSPWMAVAAVWREANPLFGEVFAFGGLTAASHEAFTARWHGPLSRITFGPPIESMEKILTLAQDGLIDFGWSRQGDVVENTAQGVFFLHADGTHRPQPIDWLIDARIPMQTVTEAGDGLYPALLRRGLARPFENTDAALQHTYRTSGLAITRDGYVLDAEGRASPTLAATGTPTEGATYDNDSLSRNRNNFVSAWAARIRDAIEHYYARYEKHS